MIQQYKAGMEGRPLNQRSGICRILTQLRVEAGLSQQEAGAAIGMGQRVISHWETGTPSPSLAHVEMLLDIFGYELEIMKKQPSVNGENDK